MFAYVITTEIRVNSLVKHASGMLKLASAGGLQGVARLAQLKPGPCVESIFNGVLGMNNSVRGPTVGSVLGK